ncbi:MAG: 2-dehydropantoate 2-reductase [Nevskia sp.]
MRAAEPRFAVFGAGSVGCYLGGRLLATGTPLQFIGRARIRAEVERHGLHCTDLDGADHRVPAGTAVFSEEAAAASAADFVLVTVKSAATAEAGRALAAVLKPGAVVISFQNGIGNAELLRVQLPGVTVLTGMVPFNVLARGEGRFHHGSAGALAVEDHAALTPALPAFARAGLPLARHADMRAVLWSKLLLNLNNAINALSGLPLQAELSQRGFRRCLALAQAETLRLLDAAGVTLVPLTKLPPHRLPLLLSVPDWLFRRLAARMVAIDPLARSSMWEDFEAGRPTEVDYINGEVLRLAERLGRRAPVNSRLVELVRAAERGGRRDWSAAELYAQLRRR